MIQSTRDLKQIMVEVEQAKNRYSNRSGFAPVQRQIGQWPRLPTSIMSDEAVDPTLLNGVITDDLEKLHHMRTIAHKAFCEHNAKSTFRRALRARPRVWGGLQGRRVRVCVPGAPNEEEEAWRPSRRCSHLHEGKMGRPGSSHSFPMAQTCGSR